MAGVHGVVLRPQRDVLDERCARGRGDLSGQPIAIASVHPPARHGRDGVRGCRAGGRSAARVLAGIEVQQTRCVCDPGALDRRPQVQHGLAEDAHVLGEHR